MWQYRQSTGELSDANGFIVGTGYSGHGDGVNNPALQNEPDIGPIPQGLYSFGAPHEGTHMGPFAIPLTPHDGNEMFGRSGFFMHGDSVEFPGAEEASRGCIIMPPAVRHEVWASEDHVLKVVA